MTRSKFTVAIIVVCVAEFRLASKTLLGVMNRKSEIVFHFRMHNNQFLKIKFKIGNRLLI